MGSPYSPSSISITSIRTLVVMALNYFSG